MENIYIRVVELFAGVGGFRLGLENCSNRFKTVWANQWEPGKAKQYAFDCYKENFKDKNCINEDIAKVKELVPKHDLLVGGFPCQDYSVARTQAKGIEGKKGVLWWEIRDIIEKNKPSFILLENVDRLLRSPASQRGRDFGVMLRCLDDLDYGVEWRVINAAEYGLAQRRRRVFIFAYLKSTCYFKMAEDAQSKWDWLQKKSLFAKAFPILNKRSFSKTAIKNVSKDIYEDLECLSKKFSTHFYNTGYMVNGEIFTEHTEPVKFAPTPLLEIIEKEKVDAKYYLEKDFEKWHYLKGAKKVERKRPNGETYYYSEGGMKFPDSLELPARTMLTSESSLNRSTHVIRDIESGKLRLLTPIECERLNGFPDNWTDTGMPEKFRYFVMGNALVVPVVTKIAKEILVIIDSER